MKGNIVSRPNRKVTDFFSKKPKTGPRPDQSVYDISSSSDRSYISISSGDISSVHGSSQLASTAGPSTRVATDIAASSRQAGHTRSTPIYVSSSPQISGGTSSSSITRGKTRVDGVHVVSNPPPKQCISPPSMPKKNVKKRKQPPTGIISSEESDDPVLPVIRVKPLSRDNAPSASGSRSHSYPSIDSVLAYPPVSVPLSSRQNTLTSSRSFPGKPSVTVLTSPSKKLEQHHQPSPQKRRRCDSPPTPDKHSSLATDDADDESEDEPTFAPRQDSWNSTPHTQHPQDDNNMDIDIPTTSPSLAVSDSNVDKKGGDVASNGQPTWMATSHEDAQDVLPSSQQDEVELNMDHNAMGVDVTRAAEDQTPASPSKLRAAAAIARIKAKVDEEVAAQAQLEYRRSLGLTASGEDSSDLSSLPSSSDEDDEEPEFELSAFCKANSNKTTRSAGPASLAKVSPDTHGIRRSTRHLDAPGPNYAKRLELFKDDSPPLKKKEKANADHKVKSQTSSSCPLDGLLKDHQREDARRAKVEKKRKGLPSSMQGSSPVMPRHHSGLFETPSRRGRHAERQSPGSDISTEERTEDDTLMGDVEREELLGKEDADAVGKILAGDRVKKAKVDKKPGGIAFWDVVPEGRKDYLPELIVSDESPLVLQSLSDKLKRGDYDAASLLINSGMLATVPLTSQLLDWLFIAATSTAHPPLSTGVYRALLVLQRERAGTRSEVQLSSRALLGALFKFGVNLKVSALLGARATEKTAVVEATQDTKSLVMYRFVVLLDAFGRSNAVEPDAMSSAVLALLLLAFDPSVGPELHQDTIRAVESLLSSSIITRAIEFKICQSIVHATASLVFTPGQEVQLLAFMSGCGLSSGRVRRWTAWAMLGGDLSGVQECGDVPPLEVLANLFAEKPTGTVRFHVDRDTDYEALGSKVELLSVALTDVYGYVYAEQSARGASGGSGSNIYGICKALEYMNGKIVDTRAAHLDRTRTKDIINRLHKRLLYQRHATLELLRGNAGKMDRFFTKKSSDTKSKPKPKLVMAGATGASNSADN